MNISAVKTWAQYQVASPLYQSSMHVGSGFCFGMLPIFIAWLILFTYGGPNEHFAKVLSHGDALMVSSALAGGALMLIFKERQRESIKLAQLSGLVGILILIFSTLVFSLVNTSTALNDLLNNRLSIKLDIVHVSWLLLSVSAVYALAIQFQAERTTSLSEFRAIYTKEQITVTNSVDFSGGTR